MVSTRSQRRHSLIKRLVSYYISLTFPVFHQCQTVLVVFYNNTSKSDTDGIRSDHIHHGIRH